ncbi:MAG: hypothetical protein OXK79_00495 [Chloroflexota bacterium]|nr:hypothetical protein [Chloroflexota bacterium]
MVFNIEPIEIMLDFERRKYRLGDTINATVTLIPSRDTGIRGSSLSLMGQVRRTKVSTKVGVGRVPYGGPSSLHRGNPLHGTPSYIPTAQQTEQEISTEVFYRATIVPTQSLREGDASKHDVALRLDPKLSKLQRLSREATRLRQDANQGLSIEPWWLEARVDVVMGRDAVARRRIEIIAPLKTTT